MSYTVKKARINSYAKTNEIQSHPLEDLLPVPEVVLVAHDEHAVWVVRGEVGAVAHPEHAVVRRVAADALGRPGGRGEAEALLQSEVAALDIFGNLNVELLL